MPWTKRQNVVVLWIAAFLAVAALTLAVASLFWLASVASDKERDRILTDVQSCEAGNRLRDIIREAHEANFEINRAVLDDSLVPDSLRLRAQPYQAAYLKAIGSIHDRDCSSIPGYEEVRRGT